MNLKQENQVIQQRQNYIGNKIVQFAPKDPVHSFYKIYGNQPRGVLRSENSKSKKDLKNINSNSNNKLSPYTKSKNNNRKSSPEYVDLSLRIIQKHNKNKMQLATSDLSPPALTSLTQGSNNNNIIIQNVKSEPNYEAKP